MKPEDSVGPAVAGTRTDQSPPLAAVVVAAHRPARRQKVSRRYIYLVTLAQFGVFVAFITPLAISLSIRVSILAPGHEEYLGYITGIGATTALITGPFLGIASDRTKSRIGRRRPYMIVGLLVGLLSLFVMALAPSVAILGMGWVLAQLGWGQVLVNLQFSTADRLPEEQRGRVAGLAGFATQIAPVLGVTMAGIFSGNALLLFVVPGVLGLVLVLLFVCLVHEADTRDAEFTDHLTPTVLLKKFVFNPVQHPDYSLVWLSRFLFYFGLTLNTTFASFFFAYKLGLSVTEVTSVIASVSILGIVATTAGAIGGGFFSDRLKMRRVFVLLAGVFFAAGAIIMTASSELPGLILGSLVVSVGIGMFSAVDQALLLDVLPERDTDAGRFMSIANFAIAIPQAVAPLVAPALLAVGMTEAGEKNYMLLYLLAGALVLLAGLVVLRIRSVR
ncbi:MFS transporter (plasmid) [Rhodococcus erythropolis R138]|uniref:MFS transporter n=1 Tax=Rhodococcus erythropolis TaxID=1833 RepID=UPI0007394C64|nr:MFS transporter [Rhodococcus erythropolis]ALU73579.1 MFS transporter [Rhodococcus erythropolis R138]